MSSIIDPIGQLQMVSKVYQVQIFEDERKYS